MSDHRPQDRQITNRNFRELQMLLLKQGFEQRNLPPEDWERIASQILRMPSANEWLRNLVVHAEPPHPHMEEYRALLNALVWAYPEREQPRAEPPSSARFLLLLLLPKKDREHVLGDLEELYRTYLLPKYGIRKARLGYWLRALIDLGPYIWTFIKRLAWVGLLWKRDNV